MKTSLKKLTSVFLAVLMLISVFSVMGVSAADTGKVATGDTTIHVTDNLGWGTMYVHYWGGSSESTWPGVQMTDEGDNGYGSHNFSASVPEDATGYVFTKGANGPQTVDVHDVNVEGYWLDGTQTEGKYNVRVWGDTGEGGGGQGGGGETTGSYYLIGYIDGADYGDGADYANMGDYHFVNGQVTATFTQDSYVCVKDTNMVWYMTQGFLGTDVTSATLYNSSITGTESNKLYVPAGTHTFTLSENGDGSLTLSYDGGDEYPTGGEGGGGETTGSYYLIGYIDGADYGDGADYANMGDYHFVNGQVTATFTQDSYVCVKDTNMVWYMTQGFLGTDVTSATLYNSSITGTESNKLYVPAGTHTFTLSENGDGSLTLSYDGGDQPTEATEETTEAPEETTAPVGEETTAPVGEETTAPVGEDTTAAPEDTTAAPEDTTAAPEATTEAPEATTEAPTLPGETGLNLTTALNGSVLKTTKVEGTTVTITYNLQAPMLLEDAQATLYYDANKLKITSFTCPNAPTAILNKAVPGEAYINFTGVRMDEETGKGYGLFDFRESKAFVIAKFDVIGAGSTTVNLDIEELDGLEADVQAPYFTQKVAADSATSIIESLKTPDVQIEGIPTTAAPEETTVPGGDEVTTSPEGQATETPEETTIPEQPTDATEETTVAPENTTAAPENTTAAPENTTAAPQNTTAAPENTTAAPENTTAAPDNTKSTKATKATSPSKKSNSSKKSSASKKSSTQAPTVAPSKVNFSKKPDVKSAVNAVSKAKSDKDPKGSKFSKLKAKVAKTTKKSNKITWSKVKGAKKYIVMGNKCGKTKGKFNKFKKLKTTKGTSFTHSKLKKNTYYKYVVLAVNGKGKVLTSSKVMHVATKGGKNTNYKKITLNKKSKTLKKGKTFKLKIKKMVKMNKKGKVKNHIKTRYESANTKIATVNSKGKIKAKKKGTTYVYAYAQNGVYARIKIKVK